MGSWIWFTFWTSYSVESGQFWIFACPSNISIDKKVHHVKCECFILGSLRHVDTRLWVYHRWFCRWFCRWQTGQANLVNRGRSETKSSLLLQSTSFERGRNYWQICGNKGENCMQTRKLRSFSIVSRFFGSHEIISRDMSFLPQVGSSEWTGWSDPVATKARQKSRGLKRSSGFWWIFWWISFGFQRFPEELQRHRFGSFLFSASQCRPLDRRSQNLLHSAMSGPWWNSWWWDWQ